jgi:hypothetical protein
VLGLCSSLRDVGRTDTRLAVRSDRTIASLLANAVPADAKHVEVNKDVNHCRGNDDLKLLILRRQLAVCGGETPGPRPEPADRALLAAVSRVLPMPGGRGRRLR